MNTCFELISDERGRVSFALLDGSGEVLLEGFRAGGSLETAVSGLVDPLLERPAQELFVIDDEYGCVAHDLPNGVGGVPLCVRLHTTRLKQLAYHSRCDASRTWLLFSMVILPKDQEAKWLSDLALDEVKAMLVPCNPKDMKAYAISTMVNSPANDSPDILDKTAS